MASFYKRKNNNGTTVWRAVIRIKGYPTVCNSFERKQEAEDWAQETERQIKFGKFNFDQYKKLHTFCTYATGHKTLAMLMHYTRNQISEQILKGKKV